MKGCRRRTLKWALIEAARGAVRKSAFFREIFDRRTDGGKRNKCRGYIAVARELCRVGHSCVKGRRQYREERPAKAPWTARQETPASEPAMDLLVRECVGPDHPMAAVAG